MKTGKKFKKRQQDNNIALTIIVAVIFLGILLGYKVIDTRQNMVDTDRHTNCRVDKQFPRDTVILMDATEALSESQVEGVINYLEDLVTDSIKYERFTLYFLNDDPETFKPQLTVCNPGDGQALDPNTNNLKKLLKTWERSFKYPIIKSAQGLATVAPSDYSPIMEMLKFVALRTTSKSSALDKRIIIVSDMVEHTTAYSQYRNPKANFMLFKDTPYFREMRPRLNDVNVHLLYVERSRLAYVQGREHVELFWKPFIESSNGQYRSNLIIN